MHVLRCMGSKFCAKFQRCPLKFHINFEPIHRKICILQGVKELSTYDILESWHLKVLVRRTPGTMLLSDDNISVAYTCIYHKWVSIEPDINRHAIGKILDLNNFVWYISYESFTPCVFRLIISSNLYLFLSKFQLLSPWAQLTLPRLTSPKTWWVQIVSYCGISSKQHRKRISAPPLPLE